MRTKTKFLALLFILFSGMAANAQVRFGVKAGVNFANAQIDIKGSNITTDALTSYQVGGIVDYALSENFTIQPGLILSNKGFNYKAQVTVLNVTTTVSEVESTPLYLEVPIMFTAGKDFGGIKIYGAVGPYIGFGIGGKYKLTTLLSSKEEDLKWGTADDSNLKSTDFGLNFGAGVELAKSIQLGVSYGMGLSNIHPKESSDYVIKNKVLSITAAYLLGGK